MKPQPQRRWLAAILTAFTLLLAAGGAQAQSEPTVTSVAAPNGSYKAGDIVPITVTFSTAVTVGIAGGTPELMLTTGNSGGTGVATYTAGTDTDELTFTYTVRTGDNIGEFRDDAEFTSEFPDTTFAAGTYLNDLAYTSATALTRNGGTIQMTAPTR